METIASKLTISGSRMFLISVGNAVALVSLIFSANAQQTDKTMLHIKVNDLSVAYNRAGHGPVLVLLHGFTVDSRMWDPQIETLSKHFTVIAWDAPGAGQSADPPETFRLSDWADCLATLLDSAVVEKAHIVGLSWGGILAQEFYHRHPDRVLSLVLADTYAGWKGSLTESIAEERLAACIRDSALPASDLVSKYLPGMFTDVPNPVGKNKLAKIMSDFHPVGFRLMARASNVDTRNILPTIKVPTLLIWGDQDKRSPLSIAHQMRAAISGAKLEIINGAGHVSNLQVADQFNKIVKDFCLSLHKK